MRKNTVKKRIIIIVVWLISVVTVSVFYTKIESRFYFLKAEQDLISQSRTLARQIPTIIQNNYYSTYSLIRMQNSKLDALSLALEHVEDTDHARDIMDEFTRVSGVSDLTLYDQDGRLIYGSGEETLDKEDFKLLQRFAEVSSGDMPDPSSVSVDSYMDDYLNSGIYREDQSAAFVRTVRDGEWILISNQVLSEKDEAISLYSDWRNVFSQIRIGNTGSLLVIDNEDGTVLSYGDREEIRGRKIDGLDLRLAGQDHTATLEELLEAFDSPNQPLRVSVDGTDCFAVRLKMNHALILALLPVPEISDTVLGVMGMLLLVLFLATGACALYAILHTHSADEIQVKRSRRFGWNKALGGRLFTIALLVGIVVFVAGLFLEALLRYADIFSYCEGKVSDASKVYNENMEFSDQTKNWYKAEYIIRCQIAELILKQTDLSEVTSQDLQRISDSLGMEYVYVFDAGGKTIATNAPYDGVVIDQDNAFHVLLEGRKIMALDPELDAVFDIPLQKAGISLQDENNKCIGMVMIVGDAFEIFGILKNLSIESVFEQIGLTDGTSVLAVGEVITPEAEISEGAAGGKSYLIDYNAEVVKGRYRIGLGSYDYSSFNVEEIGIDTNKLYDNYNGSLSVLNTTQFASVKRSGDYCLLVMQPNIAFGMDNLIQAVIITAFTLGIVLLVILASCLMRNIPAADEREDVPAEGKEESEAGTEAEREAAAGAGTPGQAGDGTGASGQAGDRATGQAGDRARISADSDTKVMTVLNSFLNRRKPDFEERWPRDCKKWKDRTMNEKYMASLKALLILSLFAIIGNAVIAHNTSVWYYIYNGQWNDGITLRSVTACIAAIWLLFILKIIIHKVLFLCARAMDTRGETVCMLLDSFSYYVLVIIGIFVCLGNFGINARALSLTAGVAGVVFGIACQSIVADILAGVLMIFEGVVHVGDFLLFNQKPEYVLSIGVRTTRLKFFGEITVVRNNEFKNYIRRPPERENLISATLTIDRNESLQRVEGILDEELPLIHDRLCELIQDNIRGPKYSSVNQITENGIELYFTAFCKGKHVIAIGRGINRELALMCERRQIAIAIPKLEVKDGSTPQEPSGSEKKQT